MTGPRRKQPDAAPRQYPSDTRRPTMTFRVRQDMVDKLKASAAERDLSVSEEVERSLNFKFDFARDAHDELVMRSIKTAFDMAEKVAGTRWFESSDAAKLCHAAIVNTADLLILGLGMDGQNDLNAATGEMGVAVASMAVNQTVGFGMTEARRRYEEAVSSYKHFDRERYVITKALSEEGLPLELATRPAMPDERAGMAPPAQDFGKPSTATAPKRSRAKTGA